MKLPYRVSMGGSPIAAFHNEDEACRYTKARAATTYQTPPMLFEVQDMSRRVGRDRGELIAEYTSKRSEQCPEEMK